MLEAILTIIVVFIIFSFLIILIGYVNIKNNFGGGYYNKQHEEDMRGQSKKNMRGRSRL